MKLISPVSKMHAEDVVTHSTLETVDAQVTVCPSVYSQFQCHLRSDCPALGSELAAHKNNSQCSTLQYTALGCTWEKQLMQYIAMHSSWLHRGITANAVSTLQCTENYFKIYQFEILWSIKINTNMN